MKEPGLIATTEYKQIEYAMKMSMQTSYDPVSTVKDEKMEVDQSRHDATKIKSETDPQSKNPLEVMKEQQFLQSVLESLPGVDTESEGVSKAMDALTGI